MRFRTPLLAMLLVAAAIASMVVLSASAAAPDVALAPVFREPAAAGKPAPGAAQAPGEPLAAASAAEAMRGHVRDRLVREHLRLAVRHAELSGRPAAGAARRARAMTPRALRRANRALRAEVRELDVPIPPVMWRIAQCESHGDPRAIGGGGAFRGALQFMQSTWEAVGGQGDPAAAPLEEQLRRGAILMARSGSSPWPHCGA